MSNNQVQVLTKDEADKVMEEASTYLKESLIDDIEIEDQADYEIFASSCGEVKALFKALEEEEEKATKPLNAVLKLVKSWFKPNKDKLVAMEKSLKAKMGAYILKVEADRKKALAEVASASRAGENTKALVAINKVESARVYSVAGSSFRFTYDIEIENVDLVPDDWWTVDEGAITRFVRATHGEKPIPGVIIHKRPIISQKAGGGDE